MSSLVGKTLGHYQVLLRIRQTATNTIYKAFDTRLGRNVTLQVIQPGQKLPPALAQRLQEHAKVLARLAHPSIGAVLECDVYDDCLCLAYDFIPRRVLGRRFKQKMEWQQAARMLVPAAQALAYAHNLGIVHGFVRPSSILLQENGAPVLFDFGVEAIVSEEVLGEAPGSWLGSQVSSYAAPEQILGNTSDPRSDIYSLGMVLYELLAGRRAYEGETPVEEALQQYDKPLKSLKKRLSRLPEIERSVLEKMLAAHPAKRFQSMQHVAYLLAKYALNQPVEPRMVQDLNWKPSPVTQWLRKVPALAWAALGVIFLACLMVSGFAALMLNPALASRLGLSLPTAPPAMVALVATRTPTTAASTPTARPTPSRTPAPTSTPAPSPTLAAQPTPISTTPPFREQPQVFQSLPLLFNTPIPKISGPITTSNALRLVTLTRLGLGLLNEIAWAPDGQKIALATTTGVYVIDTQSQAVSTYLDTAAPVHSLAFAPDGSRIATGEKAGLVRIWEVKTGKEIASLGGHMQTVNRVAFSPDGRLVASVSDDKTARLWNIESKQLVQTITQHVQCVNGLAFSPDGKILATASQDFHLMLWNTADGSRIKDMIAGAAIYDVAFTPDGKTILTGGGDFTIQPWDAASGEREKPLAITGMAISELKISPDGRFIATADDSGQVTVWNSKGEKLWSNKNVRLPRLLGANYAYTHHIAFAPDSTSLASGIWDDTVLIWKADSGESAGAIDQFSDYDNNLLVSPNSQYLAAQTIGGQVKIWDLPNAKLLRTFTGEMLPGRIFSYGVNDSRYLAIKTSPNDLKVYNLEDGNEAYSFGGHRELKTMAFSKDGIFLASGSNNEVRLWSLSSGQEIITDKNFGNGGCTIVKNLNGKTLAMATRFQFMDFDGTQVSSLCNVIHVGWMQSMTYQLDGDLIAAGGASKLAVWNYVSGEKTQKDMEGLFGFRVDQVAISPDGTMVAGAVDDLSIRIWNVSTGKEIVRLMGHEASIKGLIFTPDNKYLISSAMDGTVRIWGVQ